MNVVEYPNKHDVVGLLEDVTSYAKRNPEYRDVIVIMLDPTMKSEENLQVYITAMDTIKLRGMCNAAPDVVMNEDHE